MDNVINFPEQKEINTDDDENLFDYIRCLFYGVATGQIPHDEAAESIIWRLQ